MATNDSPPHDAYIRASWQRCVEQGLDTSARPPVDTRAQVELNEQLERNARLITLGQPVIEELFSQLDSPESMVLLADANGMVLRTVGDTAFMSRAARVVLRPGAQWDEATMGTNAIGTAIHETRTVSVDGTEHFFERNRFLTCIATPILAPGGGLLGIIDVSCDAQLALPHARALLSSTANMIERRLLSAMAAGHVLLRFSQDATLLDSPLEGVALLDEGGDLLACNRNARRLLGVSSHDLLPNFDAVFAEDWRLLGDYLQASQQQGMFWLHRREPGAAFASHLSRPHHVRVFP